MKKFYSLMVAVMVTVAAISQTTNWTGAVNSNWNDAGNWDNGIPDANTEIAVIGTGTTLSITVNTGGSFNIGGLTVNGNTNLTLTNAANRTITIANGAGATDFGIESGSVLVMGTNINITLATATVVAVIDGTLQVNTGRTYDANNTGNSTTVNGFIENSGTVSGTAVTLSFASGGTYIHARDGGTIPTATWNAASTCEITGVTGAQPGGDGQAFGNLVYDCTSMSAGTDDMATSGLSIAGNLEIVSTGAGTLAIAQGTVTVGGNFSLESGSFRIGSGTDRTLTVSGDVTVSGGTLYISNNGGNNDDGILNVAGDFTLSGTSVFSENSTGTALGAVIFNGTSLQTYSKSAGSTITGAINFTVNNNAIVDFGTSIVDGSTGTFVLNAGGKIITGSGLSSSGTSGSIQVTGTRTYDSGADYEFSGTVTGVFTTSPVAATARDIVINNTTGNVTLDQSMSVTRSLILTDGELTTTTTNLLTMNAGATCAGSSDASFVNGPVRKLFNNAESFEFPVGVSGTGNEPVSISGVTAVGYDFTAEYKRISATSLSNLYVAPILNVSGCDHWELAKNAGPAAGVSVTLTWDANSTCNGANFVTNPATLTVGHFNGASWDQAGTGGSFTANSVTRTGVTSFSPFSLANTGTGQNPLPVMFADVKAYQKNSGVQIEWSNLTERDLIKYTVERSADGRSFTAINEQLPRTNNNDKESYSVYDASPFAGVNFYRIRVLEIGGKIVLSKILKVDLSGNQQGFGLYPNPAINGLVSVSMNTKQGQYAVKVVNSAGQQVYSQRLNHQGGTMTQTVDVSTVKPGVYTMVITGDKYRESKMFIVQ